MRLNSISLLVVLLSGALFVPACGDGGSKEGEDASPEEACANLFELCPTFPSTEEACVEQAKTNNAPPAELTCVRDAEDCPEALECVGLDPEDLPEAMGGNPG